MRHPDERPPLPARLACGAHVVVQARTSLYTLGAAALYIVTGVGPKWLRATPAQHFDQPSEKGHERRFLLDDQQEGVPGTRVGYPSSFATIEQHEYDQRQARANRAVQVVAGLDVRRDSPFRDPALLRRLAAAITELLPPPTDDDDA